MPPFPKIFFSLFFLLSIEITVFGLYRIFLAYASKRWEMAQGTITQSKVKTHYDSEIDSQTYVSKIHIEYIYIVRGKEYKSKRVHIAQLGDSNSAESGKLSLNYP